MKTTFIIVSLFIIPSTIISPQLQEGSVLLGGGFTGKVESNDITSMYNKDKAAEKNTEITFPPNIGYFILENIALGLAMRRGLKDYSLEYDRNHSSFRVYEKEYNSFFGIGLFF
jgi:hypothetical protein